MMFVKLSVSDQHQEFSLNSLL